MLMENKTPLRQLESYHNKAVQQNAYVCKCMYVCMCVVEFMT